MSRHPKLLALSLAALALLVAAPAAQGKVVINVLGAGGTLGGEFGSDRGVAVNTSGVGAPAGTAYVADTVQHRVQRFSPTGAFELLWGFDVLTGGGEGFEICAVAADCKAGIATAIAANGGQLNSPRGVAVDQSNGHVYVYEQDNRRISQFEPDGDFVRAFGWNVISSGRPGDVPGTNEEQSITIGANATAGAYNLAFEGQSTAPATGKANAGGQGGAVNAGSNVIKGVSTESGVFAVGQPIAAIRGSSTQLFPSGTAITAIDTVERTLTVSKPAIGSQGISVKLSAYDPDLAWNASPAAVQAALEGISTIGPGNVSVTSANPGGGASPGGPYTVRFQGAFADTDVTELTSDSWGLAVSSGSPEVTIATTSNRAGNFEICAVAADCKRADLAGVDGGRLGGGQGSLAIDAGGDLWYADPDNRRIQQFDSSGNFIAAYGHNVDAVGGGGGLESCASTAAGDCQAATQGTGAGQFANGRPRSLAFDSAGNLYAADSTRIQRFDPTLTSAADFLVAGAGALALNSLTLSTSFTYLAPTQNGNRIAVKVRKASSSSSYHVAEFDLAGNLVEASIADSGFGDTGLFGLGSNPAADTIYASRNGDGVLVLGTAPAPVPTLDEITVFDTRGATFTGTVDPMGAPVSCSFGYSTDGVAWTDIPEAACGSLAPGGGPQAISESVTGLNPDTHYFVRLRVQRLFDRSTIVDSAREFTTEAEVPEISDVGALRVSDTSALLVGAINPNNAPTAYAFHYGAPAPDTQTPEGNLASGNSDVVVTEQIDGLTPDTTYQLKLAADNGNPQESAIVTFHTRAEPLPGPSERGYEMVTPPAKNGAPAIYYRGRLSFAVARDGESVYFCSASGFGDPPGSPGGACAHNASRREEGGWRHQALNPPPSLLTPPGAYCSPVDVDEQLGQDPLPGSQVGIYSPDFERKVFSKTDLESCPLLPTSLTPALNHYRQDAFAESASYELLTPMGGATVRTASPDFRHILYTSAARQTDDAPAGDFDKVFDWHEGELTLVSRDTSGDPFLTSSSISGGSGVLSYDLNTVSTTGDRIFFQNGSPADLYMRENATTTHHVSASECTASCGADSSESFVRATPDGSRALFTSAARLADTDTNATGTDLYLYTHSANPATDPNLTLLNRDNEASDGTDAGFAAVLGMSDGGDVVYFVATGQIVGGEATAAGPKVYRWSHNAGSPTVEYLATLSATRVNTTYIDADNWEGNAGTSRKVTPSGDHLLLRSAAQLDPVADHDADRDVYRWSQEEGWVCVSCQFPGAPSGGDARGTRRTSDVFAPEVPPNQISDDGRRVFFTSPDALVPEDVNADAGCTAPRAGQPQTCDDVYEWHDGALSLVSTGTNPEAVHLAGAGASGRDVFIITDERLTGWDTDVASDIYDYRLGGGFPEPAPVEAPCEGEACRGAGSSPGSAAGAGTRAFEGPVDPRPSFSQRRKARCPRGKRKVVRKGKSRCVKRQGKRNRGHKKRRAAADRRAAR